MPPVAASSPPSPDGRRTILITHANPEDNPLARWLAARLAVAGYSTWVDLRALRAGDDFWDQIELQLRQHAIKQIVIISPHVRKRGVMKEIALGDYIGRQLDDPDFLLPIRASNVPHGEFPPELLRRNSIDAFPNWAAVLGPLLETLLEAGVPRVDQVEGRLLEHFVTAQETGRLALQQKPETLVSNWFPLALQRPTLRMFAAAGTGGQLDSWLASTPVPHIRHSGLMGSFCDPTTLASLAPGAPALTPRFWIPFSGLAEGRDVDPFPSRAESRKQASNLLRQHWDVAMARRGLVRFEFAAGRVGWFFPDGLTGGAVKATLPDGRRINRVLSGKFKERRWHLCLVAKPRLWPEPLFRVHANVALTLDGRTPLPGAQTQKVRLRLTRSWWNDKWRDMLLAGMSWLAEGGPDINIAAGEEAFAVCSTPLSTEYPVSYEAEESRPVEENEVGDIELSDDLDDDRDDPPDDGPDVEDV